MFGGRKVNGFAGDDKAIAGCAHDQSGLPSVIRYGVAEVDFPKQMLSTHYRLLDLMMPVHHLRPYLEYG